jgi:HSP20 family protein
MNIRKYSPWNWFQHEENEEQSLPVRSAKGGGSPNLPIYQLHQEIDRLFDDALRGFPSMFRSGIDWPEITPIALTPEVDIKESDDSYTISAEVPGVAKDDVDIQIDGNTLIIKGEKKQEKKEEKENYHCVERHYGSFERMLTLPDDANAESIDAKFKNGVLTISIKRQAKSEAKETRKIEVKAA